MHSIMTGCTCLLSMNCAGNRPNLYPVSSASVRAQLRLTIWLYILNSIVNTKKVYNLPLYVKQSPKYFNFICCAWITLSPCSRRRSLFLTSYCVVHSKEVIASSIGTAWLYIWETFLAGSPWWRRNFSCWFWLSLVTEKMSIGNSIPFGEWLLFWNISFPSSVSL